MIGMAEYCNISRGQLPFVLPGCFPLNDKEAAQLRRDIDAVGVPFSLIIGDTAASFFPGDDENDNVAAGHYGRTLRGLNESNGNPAVVMLCHPIKNASRDNLLPRGGGALLNEVDGNLTAWSEVLGEVTELGWQGKIRGPDFSPLGYRLRKIPTGLSDERRRPEITIIAEPMSDEVAADHIKRLRENEDLVLRALRSNNNRSFAAIARDLAWINPEDGEPEKWRVQRAIDALKGDKLITQERARAPWTLTDKGKHMLDGDSQ